MQHWVIRNDIISYTLRNMTTRTADERPEKKKSPSKNTFIFRPTLTSSKSSYIQATAVLFL